MNAINQASSAFFGLIACQIMPQKCYGSPIGGSTGVTSASFGAITWA